MLGYKVAKHGDKRVLITLEIPDDAKTNVGRKYVVDKQKAKHRTNKAKVVSIEDADGKSYETANTSIYDAKKLTYKIGEVIQEPAFDPTLEIVCSEGIHFFLDKHVAEVYGWVPPKDWTGVWEEWYDNGQMKEKKTFERGVVVGTSTEWYESGVKKSESIGLGENKLKLTIYYPTGEKEYESIRDIVDGNQIYNLKIYYTNGQLKEDATIRNKKLEGYYAKWYETGLKWCEGVFTNSLENGPWREWFTTGELEKEYHYVNGKEHGIQKVYYKNGKLHSQYPYVNGNCHGTVTYWSEDGIVISTKNYNNGVGECCTIM
jgi:antitoxin component YwqK of YwqJK toxin-antitoxin module